MRGRGHLPAQSDKEPMQEVRRGGHLPARSAKEHVQGVRRGEHLPAQSNSEPVQDLQSRQGRVHAARSRGALELSSIGLNHTVGYRSEESVAVGTTSIYLVNHPEHTVCKRAALWTSARKKCPSQSKSSSRKVSVWYSCMPTVCLGQRCLKLLKRSSGTRRAKW